MNINPYTIFGSVAVLGAVALAFATGGDVVALIVGVIGLGLIVYGWKR